jgi:hypothetical protein
VQKQQIDVRAPECMARVCRFLRAIDQAEIDNFHARPIEALRHSVGVFLEPSLQPLELRPVSLEPDGEESDAKIHGDVRYHYYAPFSGERVARKPDANVLNCTVILESRPARDAYFADGSERGLGRYGFETVVTP